VKLVKFRLEGRFGHFLRAEANASAPSYPVPPRTAILGLLGAILGLAKDEPQAKLEPAHIALSGPIPQTHWHKAKFRKDPPAKLPWTVKKSQKADKQTTEEKATLITQEWLFNPRFTIWAALPEPFHGELEARVRDRRWHFQPSLGLSEMMADVIFEESIEAQPLPKGIYHVCSAFLRTAGSLQMPEVFEKKLALHAQRMPRLVTPDRVFTHESYFLEKNARPVPLETECAFKAGKDIILFL